MLEQVAAGEDPDLILHTGEDGLNPFRVNTFQEINLNDPFPKKITTKPLTVAQTIKLESKNTKLMNKIDQVVEETKDDIFI